MGYQDVDAQLKLKEAGLNMQLEDKQAVLSRQLKEKDEKLEQLTDKQAVLSRQLKEKDEKLNQQQAELDQQVKKEAELKGCVVLSKDQLNDHRCNIKTCGDG